MVKHGTKSASIVQARTARHMDNQNHGMPKQWNVNPQLVSGKRSQRKDLLLLAAEIISGAVCTARMCRQLRRDHAND